MKFNNSPGWNRIVRVAGGMTLLYLGWANIVPGGFGVSLRYFGLLPLITGLVGFRPMDLLLKLKAIKA